MMTSDINDKIAEMRENRKLPCPTDRLLCIATGVKTDKDLRPWSEQIRQQAGTTDDYFIDINQAVIFGRYPELEEACKYFREEAGKTFHQLDPDIKKSGQLPQEAITKLAQETVKRYHLEGEYSFVDEDLTLKQEERIEKRLKDARQATLQYCHESHQPETNMIHDALRSSIKELDPVSSIQLMKDMRYLDSILCDGPEKLAKVRQAAEHAEFAELHDMAAKVFNMRKRGIDFSNPEAVKNSPEMQDISYQGKKYDLSTKIASPLSRDNQIQNV